MSLAVRFLALAILLVTALRAGSVASAEVPNLATGRKADESLSGADVSDRRVGSGSGTGSGEARTSIAVLGARTLFESNEADLSAEGGRALERLVDALVTRHVADGSLLGIRIVGHTDGIGTDLYNLRLSERRAASIGAVIARRYPDVPIVTEGAGERAPVASDATAAGRARNRRVEIRVVALERR